MTTSPIFGLLVTFLMLAAIARIGYTLADNKPPKYSRWWDL